MTWNEMLARFDHEELQIKWGINVHGSLGHRDSTHPRVRLA
jgi:hypothetical protein